MSSRPKKTKRRVSSKTLLTTDGSGAASRVQSLAQQSLALANKVTNSLHSSIGSDGGDDTSGVAAKEWATKKQNSRRSRKRKSSSKRDVSNKEAVGGADVNLSTLSRKKKPPIVAPRRTGDGVLVHGEPDKAATFVSHKDSNVSDRSMRHWLTTHSSKKKKSPIVSSNGVVSKGAWQHARSPSTSSLEAFDASGVQTDTFTVPKHSKEVNRARAAQAELRKWIANKPDVPTQAQLVESCPQCGARNRFRFTEAEAVEEMDKQGALCISVRCFGCKSVFEALARGGTVAPNTIEGMKAHFIGMREELRRIDERIAVLYPNAIGKKKPNSIRTQSLLGRQRSISLSTEQQSDSGSESAQPQTAPPASRERVNTASMLQKWMSSRTSPQ